MLNDISHVLHTLNELIIEVCANLKLVNTAPFLSYGKYASFLDLLLLNLVVIHKVSSNVGFITLTVCVKLIKIILCLLNPVILS